MIRSFAVAIVCFLSLTVLGQTTTTTSTTDLTVLGDHTPTENLSGASVAARAPGTWITAARERHQAFIQARITNPRNGEAAGTTDGLEPVSDSSTGSSGGTSALGGLGDLGSLLDLVGGAGGLTGLVGGATTGSTTGTTGGMTLQDLLALRDQLMGGSSTTGTSTTGTSDTTSGKAASGNGKTASRSSELRGGSGAIGRLPKLYDQSATTGTTTTTGTSTTTDTRKFLPRLADGLADSFFSALTLGFQSDAFITYLESWMNAILAPQTSTDSSSSSDSGSGSVI